MRIVLIPVRLLAVVIWAVGATIMSLSVLISAVCGNLEATWEKR